MRTILVDDEVLAMEHFETEIKRIEEEEEIEIVERFENPILALEYARHHRVELAVLDIRMPKMDGISLAKGLRKIYKDMLIVFVSRYEQYAAEAFRIKADYYVMKPYSENDIRDVVERIKLLSKRQKARVYFQTFGRFELFIDEEVVQIRNAKAKELLALCVDRKGRTISMEEAIDILWEDRVYDEKVKGLYRKAVMFLNHFFKEQEISGVFINGRGFCRINPAKIECDYFEYLNGRMKDLQGIKEYMIEYSWAEKTLAKWYSNF